jgi:choline/glycine/proline betaine transport protein
MSSEETSDWKEKLNNIVSTPDKKDINQFLNKEVKRAFKALKAQFELNDIEVEIKTSDKCISLVVNHGEEHDFIYGVYKKEHVQPSFSHDQEEGCESYYRAEVHLLEGGQDYDIMGWSETAVINDVINQYQKHMHFLHILRDEGPVS